VEHTARIGRREVNTKCLSEDLNGPFGRPKRGFEYNIKIKTNRA
jgi:hypothetical protein